MAGHGEHKHPRTTIGWMGHKLKHEFKETWQSGAPNFLAHWLTYPFALPFRLPNMILDARRNAKVVRAYEREHHEVPREMPDERIFRLAFDDLARSKLFPNSPDSGASLMVAANRERIGVERILQVTRENEKAGKLKPGELIVAELEDIQNVSRARERLASHLRYLQEHMGREGRTEELVKMEMNVLKEAQGLNVEITHMAGIFERFNKQAMKFFADKPLAPSPGAR